MDNIRTGQPISGDRKLQKLQQKSDAILNAMKGQPAVPTPVQQQEASRKQLMGALSKLLARQHAGPQEKGTVGAKNLDFAKPYQ